MNEVHSLIINNKATFPRLQKTDRKLRGRFTQAPHIIRTASL